MPADVYVSGGDQLTRLAEALRKVDDHSMRLKIARSLRAGAKPVIEAAKANALADMPHRGGLNRVVADSAFGVRQRTSGGVVKVSVRATGRKVHDIAATNRGRLRHPVFGNRKVWVNQQVKSGWWDRATAVAGEPVRASLLTTLEALAEEVGRATR